ncbi:MAG: ATP-dependent helicase DeaD [Myxococcales bacterium]|nr:ATP-dependent helicase DeaD [Myxococcales bacterium]
MTQPLASTSGSAADAQAGPLSAPPAAAAPAAPAAPPAPTFDALPLSPDVRQAIDALGYVNPTPVQLAVFEPATRGKSLVVQARTGTGKTAAFGLPIIDVLVRKGQPNVQALILTPTRELALQVSRELEQLGKIRGTKIVAIYGGAPMGKQIEALEGGAQVVVGTPGRVLDHCRRGTLDTKNIRILVLDEADEMLSMGFAKELNAIIDHLPPGDRQGLYFSATLPPDVERLANKHLKNPEYVTLSSDQVGALQLTHYIYLVRDSDKRQAILSIIEVEDPQSAVIFCNTKDETERVAELLKSRGYDADWLNGDLEQKERERVMSATREGKLRFLVATDVAARGIDISHLTHVINADFPESAEQYVHRTGRTGRAGRTGTAISVVGPKDVGHLYMLRLTYKIRPIERMLPTKGELKTRAEADIVTFLAEAYAGRTADAMHLAVARRLFTHEQAESIVAGLLADHLGANAAPDPIQDAADARRAKNPPVIEAPAAPPAAPLARRDEPREAPRTLRDGERASPPPGEGRGRRADGPRRDEPRRDGPRRDEPRRDGPRRDAPRDASRDVSREGVPRDRGMGARDRSAAPRGEPMRPEVARDRSADAARQGREGVPQATLSEWEPPADEDDDRPIIPAGANVSRRSGAAPRTPSMDDALTAVGLPDEPAIIGRPRDANDDDDDAVDTDRHPRLPKLPGITEEGASGTSASALTPPTAPRGPRREGRGPGRPTRERAPREPRSDAREPRADREPREAREREPDARPAPDDPNLSNIFLNVGRRDGVNPEDLQRLLAETGGIPEAETGNIRVRDRITFVTVKKELADRAIQALAGQVIGGRTVIAEPARDKG